MLPEETYGWGVLALPVSRAPAAGAGDAAWHRLFFSSLATLLVIAGTLLYRQLAPLDIPVKSAAPPPVAYRMPTARMETPPPPTARPQPAEVAPVLRRTAAARRLVTGPSADTPPPPAELTPPEIPVPSPTEAPVATALPPRVERPLRAAEPEIHLDAPASIRTPRAAATDRLPRERLALERAADISLPSTGTQGRAPRPATETALPAGTSFQTGIAQPAEIDLQPAPTTATHRRDTAKMAGTERTSVQLAREPSPTLAIPAKNTPLPRPVQQAETAGPAFAFLDRLHPAELDRSFLVSLSRLATCLDPGAENALKTRLATLLDRPALCRSGGVMFDVLYPESAYSIHINLYNYERRDFADRCAALRQAVECFEARR